MQGYSVVVTDHDFDDLSIERSILNDIATVRDCTKRIGATAVDTRTLQNADAILNLRAPLDADRIAKLDRCRVIARYGIGVDNVDVSAATKADIPVTNVPDYCIEEVSIHTLTLGLNLVRGVKQYDESVARNEWSRDVVERVRRLSELTVGIVGYGDIGRAVGKRAAAIGASVIAADPYLELSDLEGDPVELVSFEELLSRSHLVTIHSPLTEETRGLFDADVFADMRDGAFLVNVARGPIVESDQLLEALESGTIGGAALDVFPNEPPAKDHPLRDHPRTIITPHIAWYSQEANDERRRSAAKTVWAALKNDRLENVVNNIEP